MNHEQNVAASDFFNSLLEQCHEKWEPVFTSDIAENQGNESMIRFH